MATTTRDIAPAFANGRSARTANFYTAGDRLYSYDVCIARRVNGKIVVGDYAGVYSRTTSKHVNYIRRYADEVLAPAEFENLGE